MAASDHLNSQQFYLRFGDWSGNERSFSTARDALGETDPYEKGVSVYRMDTRGNPVNPDPGHTSGTRDVSGEMRSRADLAAWSPDSSSMRGHIVTGREVGTGSDNEPLLKNVTRVGGWVRDRHKILPGVTRHPYAESKQEKTFRVYKPPPA